MNQAAPRPAPRALACLYVAAAAVYVLLGLLRQAPTIVPDELTYAHLGSSLAHGQGFSWGGAPVDLRAALYVYLITPSWWISSGSGAYTIAKVIGALAICSVVFPTYALARGVIPGRLALLPPALVVLGTWMTASGGILTENIAFPLASLTLLATVRALQRPGTPWAWIALGCALLTTWSRYQLVVLVPGVFSAMLFDVMRAGPSWRERWRAHRIPLLLALALGIGWVIAFAIDRNLVLGNYTGVGGFRPGFGELAKGAWDHWVALVLMTGVLPLIGVIAMAVRRSSWTDRDIGPLLATLVPFGILIIAQSAFFTAGFGHGWEIDRYVQYAVPLVFVVFVAGVARADLPWRIIVPVAAIVATTLFAGPGLESATEQRAIYAIATRMDDLVGTATKTSLGLVGLLLTAGGLAAGYAYRRDRSRRVMVIVGLVAALIAVESQTVWQWQTRQATEWAKQFPSDKAWIDHHTPGPVARVVVSANSPLAETLQFFNRDIEQVYIPATPATYSGLPPRSNACGWNAPNGQLNFGPGCGDAPRRLLLDDPWARLTFYGQRVLARHAKIGSIVEVPRQARLRSVLILPCPKLFLETTPAGAIRMQTHAACGGELVANLWLQAQATLLLAFQGGVSPNTASFAGRTWRLPPGRRTVIRIEVPKGPHRLQIGLDWTDSDGAATLTAAELLGDGAAQNLM
jgi:hypothetical protein